MSTSNVNDIAGSKREAGVFPRAGARLRSARPEADPDPPGRPGRGCRQAPHRALSQMQERLGAARQRPRRAARISCPARCQPVLDRIQGGMAELSDRIAEADAQRRRARPRRRLSARHRGDGGSDRLPPAPHRRAIPRRRPRHTGNQRPPFALHWPPKRSTRMPGARYRARSGGKQPTRQFRCRRYGIANPRSGNLGRRRRRSARATLRSARCRSGTGGGSDRAVPPSLLRRPVAMPAPSRRTTTRPPSRPFAAVEPTAPTISHLPAMLPGLPAIPASPPPSTKAEIAAEVVHASGQGVRRRARMARAALCRRRAAARAIARRPSAPTASLDAIDARFFDLESKLAEVDGQHAP